MRRLRPFAYSISSRVWAELWYLIHTTPVQWLWAFYRRLRDSQLPIPFSPATTWRQVFIAFLLWEVPAVVFINTYQLAVLGVGPPLSPEALVDRLIETGILAPFKEEAQFKFLGWFILGNTGVVLSTVWRSLRHPGAAPGGFIRILDTGMTGVFMVKVWQGRPWMRNWGIT